jgi:hypothetical protein
MAKNKLDALEQLEFKNLVLKKSSIESLINRLIIEQGDYDNKLEEWFLRIRDRYKVSDDIGIYIDDDYNIVEEEPKI